MQGRTYSFLSDLPDVLSNVNAGWVFLEEFLRSSDIDIVHEECILGGHSSSQVLSHRVTFNAVSKRTVVSV
jgi:hypothetical protein